MLNGLQRLNYCVDRSMGSIHRERYSFDRLSGIRLAYAAAFSKDYVGIDAALANEVLDAVSQVRNIIAHRAGIADGEYVKRARSLPGAPQVSEGLPLLFDGDSFCALVVPMLESTEAFIFAVDEWMSSH
jgi:hypothetical protein